MEFVVILGLPDTLHFYSIGGIRPNWRQIFSTWLQDSKSIHLSRGPYENGLSLASVICEDFWQEHHMDTSPNARHNGAENFRVSELLLEEWDDQHRFQVGDVVTTSIYPENVETAFKYALVCIKGSEQ
jgi:hypothetical protein